MNKDIPVSFEVFPPNTTTGLNKLYKVCHDLSLYKPQFISVTYGAAGGAQLKTVKLVKQLTKQKLKITPHISCVGMTKNKLKDLLEIYIKYKVTHLVVVRGDFFDTNEPHDFKYAAELVSYIRKLTDNHFHIIVAAYPEFHPQALSPEIDLHYFKEKVDAGANSAITQFFFNSDAYCRFKEQCLKRSINIPIIPGIMPINDYNKLLRFANICGAEIPLWLRKQLEIYADNIPALQSLAIDLITKHCARLITDGAEALHFYTLNKISPTLDIYNNIFKWQSENIIPNRLQITA